MTSIIQEKCTALLAQLNEFAEAFTKLSTSLSDSTTAIRDSGEKLRNANKAPFMFDVQKLIAESNRAMSTALNKGSDAVAAQLPGIRERAIRMIAQAKEVAALQFLETADLDEAQVVIATCDVSVAMIAIYDPLLAGATSTMKELTEHPGIGDAARRFLTTIALVKEAGEVFTVSINEVKSEMLRAKASSESQGIN